MIVVRPLPKETLALAQTTATRLMDIVCLASFGRSWPTTAGNSRQNAAGLPLMAALGFHTFRETPSSTVLRWAEPKTIAEAPFLPTRIVWPTFADLHYGPFLVTKLKTA